MKQRTEDRVYTISALTLLIKYKLEENFATVQVQGEVSGVSQPGSGHLYFQLKDAKSRISCVAFRTAVKRFRSVPKNGDSVILGGRISVYPPQGSYQLYVEQIMSAAGKGDVQQQFEETKAALAAEGLFEPERKRPLPALPSRIALVTSPDSAVLQDLSTICLRRFPGVRLLLSPTLVQGENSQHQIARALQRADSAAPDLIILARGGGSPEDLQAFNTKEVAYAIAKCTVPVISAVGHETDFSIADFVADLRAATPSEAAELALPLKAALEEDLQHTSEQLVAVMRRYLALQRSRVELYHSKLRTPRHALHTRMQWIDTMQSRLIHRHKAVITAKQQMLLQQRHALLQHSPLLLIGTKRHALERLHTRLIQAMQHLIEGQQGRLHEAVLRLNAGNPWHILEKGYTKATTEGGQAVQSVHKVAAGQRIQLILVDGRLQTRVEEVQEAQKA